MFGSILSIVAFTLFVQVSALPSFLTFDQLNHADAGVSNWAVLVAGSSGYYNYRHQADICHAYQLLRANGFPEHRIITLMADDVANHPANPFKGTLINHPNGKDVYHGVVKDYTGASVTPHTFMAVLTGDKDAVRGLGSGKVLRSTSNDEVFIYFADHGGVGLIAFPSGHILSSKSLQKTLKRMHEKQLYKKLVFYMEACESGSMFEGSVLEEINIYATTAANAHQSSYACYYDAQRQTYLGDVYSVNWMEDSDKYFLGEKEKSVTHLETLYRQFKTVKTLTTTSEVTQFGDKDISAEDIDDFQVYDKASSDQSYFASSASNGPTVEMDSVDSRDVTMSILKHKLELAASTLEKIEIAEQIQAEQNNIFNAETKILRVLNNFSHLLQFENDAKRSPLSSDDHDCLHHSLHTFDRYCDALNEYYIRYSKFFALACQHPDISTKDIMNNMVEECKA